MSDDGTAWMTRVRLGQEPAERAPSIAAYGFQYCDRTGAVSFSGA
jgi:hypothetical protein